MMPIEDDIAKAKEAIEGGGILLYPTDTVWGIGCDALNERAVRKVYEAKGRPAGKSMILLLDCKEKLPRYIRECPEIICDLLEAADRPLTIIFPGAKNIAPSLIADDGSIAIRIVKHPFCTPLIEQLDRPIVSSSANLSDTPTPLTFKDINPRIIEKADYVAESFRHALPHPKPSRIIRFDEKGNFTVVRE